MRQHCFFVELPVVTIIAILLLASSCSMKQFYPTAGAVVGGSVGSLGGPGVAALGAGGGALLGEVARGNAEIKEARETITALTHGDVEALVAKGMTAHETTFESFVSKIQSILFIAGALLGCYLAIPIFVARKCAISESKKSMTRPPFPSK